jgi:hypothetical protein
MRPLLRQFVSVAALILIATFAAAQDAVLQEITLRGTVEAIDHTARTVRIRGAQGNVVTLDVPTTMMRFDQVKVGDQVTIAYYDQLSEGTSGGHGVGLFLNVTEKPARSTLDLKLRFPTLPNIQALTKLT